MFAIYIENLETLKYHIFFKKNIKSLVISHEYKKYLKKKNQLKY